jgi:hypothetical protein
MDKDMRSADIDEVKSLLAEVGELKQGTRAVLQRDGWQWLLVWGSVCLGAALSAYTPLAPWYWVGAVPVAMAVTWILEKRLEGRAPVRVKSWPYWTIGGAITAAAFGASFAFDTEVTVVVVWVVFGLGFMGFSLLERQRAAAGVFLGLAGITTFLGVVTEDRLGLYPVLGFMFAITMAGVSAGIRQAARR